jgi:inhibitor of KinA
MSKFPQDMSSNEPIIKMFGDAILIAWKQEVSQRTHQKVLSAEKLLKHEFSQEILSLTISYNEILVKLNKDIELEKTLQKLKEVIWTESIAPIKTTKWFIPVCYDQEFGIDLNDFALAKNMSIEEIITLHTAPVYRVYFIGFLPGFLYLGGLDENLYKTRRSSPRQVISKGSVAIGGQQTGIYPFDSPGGWHIIGRTPVPMFQVSESPPSFFRAGDEVIFYKITKALFDELVNEGISPAKLLAKII